MISTFTPLLIPIPAIFRFTKKAIGTIRLLIIPLNLTKLLNLNLKQTEISPFILPVLKPFALLHLRILRKSYDIRS